jgi:putative phosphoesterase
MKKIGLLSDTHGYLDPEILYWFSQCDEIWHAGDIGSAIVADQIEALKPLLAVFGNIDGMDVRLRYPQSQSFKVGGMGVFLTHIGGYPGRYARDIRKQLLTLRPGLFISGHSHILKVIHDDELNLLHINPGAAGKAGMQQVRTIVRFEIGEGKIENLEVNHLGKR